MMLNGRSTGLLVAISLMTASCASSEGSADFVPDTPTTASAEEGSADGVDGTVEEWAMSVMEAVDAEAADWQPTFAERFAEFDPSREVEWTAGTCRAEADLLEIHDAAMPAAYGSDFEDAVYSGYLDARANYTAATLALCDAAEADIDGIQELIDGGGPAAVLDHPYGLALAEKISAEDERLAACFPLQEIFAAGLLITDSILNCGGEADFEFQLPEDSAGGGEIQAGVDPTAGPTGGPMAGFAELPSGPARFDWFPAPFTLDHPESLLVIAGDDFIWFTNDDDSATLEVWAVEEVADPSDIGGSVIPAPDALGPWLVEMPVNVLDETPTTIGGIEATRWFVEVDADAAISATGEPNVALWGDDAFGVVIEGFEESASRIIWEVRHPNGSLFLATVMVRDAFGVEDEDGLEWAESVVADIVSFG